MADGDQSQGSSSGSSLSPLVGGLVGMTPIGSRFILGYRAMADLQAREEERRRLRAYQDAYEKATGMPMGQSQGEEFLRRIKTEQEDRAEALRLRGVESASRTDPVTEPFESRRRGLDTFTMPTTQTFPMSPDRPERSGKPYFTFSDRQTRDILGGRAPASMPPEVPSANIFEDQSGQPAATAQIGTRSISAPTLERDTGTISRPPTLDEIVERQTRGGLIKPGEALIEKRRIAEERLTAEADAAFEALNPTPEERAAYSAGRLNGGRSAGVAIQNIKRARKLEADTAASDAEIDQSDLSPERKAELKQIPDLKARTIRRSQMVDQTRKARVADALIANWEKKHAEWERQYKLNVDKFNEAKANPKAAVAFLMKERNDAEKLLTKYETMLNKNNDKSPLFGKPPDDPAVMEAEVGLEYAKRRLGTVQTDINLMGRTFRPEAPTGPPSPRPYGSQNPPVAVPPPAIPGSTQGAGTGKRVITTPSGRKVEVTVDEGE
jgi:hypothetical protein